MPNHDQDAHSAHALVASSHGGCGGGSKPDTAYDSVKDPVCGMTVDPAATTHHGSHAGAD